MSSDELGFEFVETCGFFLREVGSLRWIGDDVEELEADKLSVLNLGEVGLLPA